MTVWTKDLQRMRHEDYDALAARLAEVEAMLTKRDAHLATYKAMLDETRIQESARRGGELAAVQRAERDWLSKELEHMRVSYSSCDAALAQCEQNSQRIAAERDALRAALDAHNSGCIGACEARAKDCEAYTSRGLQCPECPRDWMVDTEAALAARGKASE